MPSFPPRAGALILLLSALLVAPTARAADGVAKMAEELRSNEDFRVRTQAALALGATKDKEAVRPLCTGLEDSNTTVRAAAAAALGKLALGGAECLKERLDNETNASVKSVLQKALDSLKAGSAPALSGDTRFYVAFGPTTDKTGRDGTGVDDLVRAALEEAASGLGGCVVAPKEEKPAAAKAVVAKYKQLKSFFLWPKVQPPDYASGNLTVKFEVAVFTYPAKALKGTIPLKLTMPDVQAGDLESENDLIRRAAAKAFERFVENADRFAQ